MDKKNNIAGAEPAASRYQNPPIQEAVCEIHFKIAQPLNQEALLKMEPVWSPAYPLKNVAADRQIKIFLALDKMDSTQQEIGHKLIMRSPDAKKLAQLGATFMAVNQLSPYQGWDESFRDDILGRFGEVQKMYGIDAITQIGLRYINRIDFPQRPLCWNEWFAVTLPIPDGNKAVGGDFHSFYRREIADNMISQINFATIPPLVPEKTSVLLDIDVVFSKDMPVNDLYEALEKVHAPHRSLFEGFLLDKTRELFNI